jgi:hypothetical protein
LSIFTDGTFTATYHFFDSWVKLSDGAQATPTNRALIQLSEAELTDLDQCFQTQTIANTMLTGGLAQISHHFISFSWFPPSHITIQESGPSAHTQSYIRLNQYQVQKCLGLFQQSVGSTSGIIGLSNTAVGCLAPIGIINTPSVKLEVVPIHNTFPKGTCQKCGDEGNWIRMALMCRKCNTLICGC